MKSVVLLLFMVLSSFGQKTVTEHNSNDSFQFGGVHIPDGYTGAQRTYTYVWTIYNW